MYYVHMASIACCLFRTMFYIVFESINRHRRYNLHVRIDTNEANMVLNTSVIEAN